MRIRMLVASAGLCFVCLTSSSAAQQPRANGTATALIGTAAIGGVITTPADGGAERPLRRVMVRLASSDGRGMRETVTDDLGRFVFTELPAGRFTITAIRPGYLTIAYGAKRTKGTGTAVPVAAGQRELGLRISMPRGAVITGTITDGFRKPIANALVELLERSAFGGTTTLTRGGASVVTDDRGVYRLFGLAPGTFFVTVTSVDNLSNPARQTTDAEVRWATRARTPGDSTFAPPANPVRSLAPVYYPGTIDVRAATAVTVEAGQERAGVDFAIQFVPVVRVAGTLVSPDGRSAGIAVTLQPEAPPGFDVTVSPRLTRGRTTVGANGEFVFDSIQPGSYAISAQLGTNAGELWLKEHVEVMAQDVTGLAFAMRYATTISGRVAFAPDATTQPPSVTGFRVRLVASGLGAPFRISNPEADGNFSIRAAQPGPYRLVVEPSRPISGVPTWTVKSIVVGGRDVMDRTFDSAAGQNLDDVVITLTDKIASLSGRLMDGEGKPAPDYFVVMMPVDRTYWQSGLSRSPKSLRPGNDGAFRFDGLMSGEYYIVAADEIDNLLLYRADYLEQLIPSAIKLTIGEGEKKVQDLKIGK